MALITRLTRLFRADFHAVLDRVEEPEILLRQAIREMEEDLSRDGYTYSLREQEREQLGKREGELRLQLDSLAEQLDVCLDADRQELAQSLMRRKLEAERSLLLLARRRDGLDTRLEQLMQRLNDNRARYEGMRQKADLFDEQSSDAGHADAWAEFDVRVCDEDIEVALLKERQRRAEK